MTYSKVTFHHCDCIIHVAYGKADKRPTLRHNCFMIMSKWVDVFIFTFEMPVDQAYVV